MRFPTTILSLLLLTSSAAYCQGDSAWVSLSGRAENLLVLPYLTADFDTAIMTVKALSLREDPYIGEILAWFQSHVSPEGRLSRQAEIQKQRAVFAFLLSGFFSSALKPVVLQSRIEANRKELAEILQSLPFIEDNDIKIEAVRLIGLFGEATLYPLIVRDLEKIVEKITLPVGLLSQPDEKLAYLIMQVIARCKITESRAVLQAIVQKSRSEILVKTARSILSGLSLPRVESPLATD